MSSKKVATLITADLNLPLHFSCLGSGMTTNDLLFICTTSFMKINYEPTTYKCNNNSSDRESNPFQPKVIVD